MIEKQTHRNGKKVIEVRSEGGKLLYVKTEEGYEMKCPRTKQICLVRYDKMLFDCLKCFSGISDEDQLLEKTKQFQEALTVSKKE